MSVLAHKMAETRPDLKRACDQDETRKPPPSPSTYRLKNEFRFVDHHFKLLRKACICAEPALAQEARIEYTKPQLAKIDGFQVEVT